jgi:hypothetical protein
LKDADFVNFSNLQKTGEVEFNNSDELIVFTCKFQGVLSERSSKKKQFEIAKKVLKEDFKDGAIFIFYDDNDCFRFSFIRKNYGNKDQKFSNWKRYTYFVDPARTNKTFKNRINGCNFSSLEDIQEAFSVEKLNKKFYEEIATAFYGLIGGKVSINKKEVSFDAKLQLPSTPVENRKVYQEFAVRLIGRTIFCWFLKNKKSDSGIPLIPEEWLSSNMVISVNNDQHNYYHSILEKLFFLVLNKKHEDRKPYVLPNNHEFVPFLNGGLFEAQDDDFFPKDSKGIHSQNFALNIPNQWFQDFFETLEQYNFTIDENSINDFEVSIDPEMLGTIFENLLAEIDPDTEKSARKSTGSFYTPREIVDYMVEQSLLQYIKTKTNIEDEEQLEVLLKDDTENPFNEKQTIAILEALSEVKILDPACGSGAFPMGVLHKIIALLKKLDKGAVWWKAKQLEKIDNALVKKTMEAKLDNANSDYIRKLGVIQHSIYGVDIQPIAAEISKLRSFLSLIIDENIDDNHPDGNRGIVPLPNLEFKFVTANTLNGLSAEKQQTTFDFGENEEILVELQKIRNSYLQASPEEKSALKKNFKTVQNKINKTNNTNNLSARESQLYHWEPFSNDSSAWFDPDWMFGVKNFDLVIGNPPYSIIFDKVIKKNYDNNFVVFKRNNDIYTAFYERGVKMLNKSGLISYITPNTFLNGDYYKELRKFLSHSTKIIEIFDFKQSKVFQDPTVYVCIFISQKSAEIKNYDTNLKIINSDINDYQLINLKIERNSDKKFKPSNLIIDKIFNNKNVSLLDNEFYVKDVGFNYWSIGKGKKRDGNSIGDRILYSGEKQFDIDKSYIKGRDIDKYHLSEPSNFLKHNFQDFLVDKVDVFRYSEDFLLKTPKLIYRQTSNRIIATIDYKQNLVDKTIHIIVPKTNKPIFDLICLCGLINSKLYDYLYKYISQETDGRAFAQVKTIYLKQFPVLLIKKDLEDEIVSMINIILDKKNQNGDTSDLEDKIDLMVYKLYELTYDEVLIVEPAFGLSEQVYNTYKI